MTIEEIIAAVNTDAITIFKGGLGWQVSIKRPGTNAYSVGIDKDMTKAFRKAAGPWLDDHEDDWRALI